MKFPASLRRAAALGFFALPVFCGPSAQAAVKDAYYAADTTVTTAVTGSAYIGKSSANSSITAPKVVFTSTASVGFKVVVYGGSLTISTGCAVGESVTVNNSAFTMNGGTIGSLGDTIQDVVGSNNAAITINGGTLTGNLGSNGGTVALNGGTVNGLVVANPGGSITYSGGSVLRSLRIFNNATLNITGTGLTATALTSDLSGSNEYSVSGTLTDHTVLNGQIVYAQLGAATTFQFNGQPAISPASTPAPGSLSVALLGFAGLSFGLARRRKG